MKSKLGFSLVELLVVIAVVMLVGLVTCQAGTVTEPTTFRDVVKFRGSTGPDFDAANVFSIGGTKVTATAAQLNAATSVGVTNATLTQSKAAITATASVATWTTNIITYLDATTNAASSTNVIPATMTVTVVNGGAVCTNASINLNP